MPNDPLQNLIQSLTPVRGTVSPNSGATDNLSSASPSVLGESLLSTSSQIAELRSVLLSQVDASSRNTQALADNTVVQGQSAIASAAAAVGKSVAGSIGGGGLLAPIISGLLKLFGGGGSEAASPPPMVKYALPESVQVNAGISASAGLTPVDYSQNGQPRANAPAAAPQVTVQINAMDSRSFLDRSDDIAQAVRRAMLESSALNDVVAEI